MKKYNHAFDLAFEVETDHPGSEVTVEEILDGLRNRLRYLTAHADEVLESTGLPFDTYENPTENQP